ncbi:MAG TPA: beta-ketoacyl synthase chain length factor [Planctomycetota bacterium]|nr:beta-ketoacyl synthase chain length factor [Planctomycetota bacterium]
MNEPGTVAITGLGLWTAGFPSAAAWARGVPDSEAQKPLGKALDKVNRRRAGPLGRALADVVAEAIAAAGADMSSVPTVIGSSIGEAATMIGLLDELWRHHNPMSPADFTMSVHNAASGLISISNKNRGMTTSLAADENTPAAALLEGIGLVLTRNTAVVVACGDEPAPPTLVQHAPPWAMLASAVVLAPLSHPKPPLATLRIVADRQPSPRGRFEQLLVDNPQFGLLALVDAVLRHASGVIALDRGTGRGYGALIAPGARA